ncbi:MAG TPA: biotin carboxylase N-terminal domain-containing protein [Nonomuraea sp.]|nr:biotin carboxylase N-terminal domain-containing protein [Nonomuraea sp.]
MVSRLLVANRGEIARRVFRTCRTLGISTVAVFTDPDADAPHVAEADVAVRLPGTAGYLDIERVVAACRATGADAVHPGYGFLSESAAFARAVLAAGLTWVGPPPAAIEAMGSKIAAKRLMAAAGVPVLPTLDLTAPGEFPLLVKASAGGGGRGMRVVREPGELDREIASARREAEAAFGDPAVFAEPLLERARHVEVQVLADTHGTVWTLGERECSIQRRHQKVVEECPSPGVSPELRERLCEAAVRAARAIGYTGAGTVEFLVRGDRVAFLEMNTRLQVEHPVTELVYGVDLVRMQLEVAEGAALPPVPPEPSGHAVEVRLYAEDSDFLPQSGVLRRFEVAGDVRVDSGVESGSAVSPYYDPMLAKVIAHGSSRAAAVRKLVAALRRAKLHGLANNRDLLLRILTHPAFAAGDTHTDFLPELSTPADDDTTGDDTAGDPAGDPAGDAAGDAAGGLPALAAALSLAAANRRRAAVLASLPSGWRNVRSQARAVRFAELAAETVYDPLPEGVIAVTATPDRVVLERDGVRHAFDVARYDEAGPIYVDHAAGDTLRGGPGHTARHQTTEPESTRHQATRHQATRHQATGHHAVLTPLPRLPEPVEEIAPGSLLAPMPGGVLRVEVTAGERVVRGQVVLVLEAMKMEHRIVAPADGVVSGVRVDKGQQVEAGAVLAIIEEGDR